jgi:hypothetical protein
MTIRERLYWLLFSLRRRGKFDAQALGFPFDFYRSKALAGEYPHPNRATEYDITITPAVTQPGGKYYRVVLVHHLQRGENGGKHHLQLDVVDTAGQRINGARLVVWNNNLPPVYATIDKPANEPGTNVPMWWTSTLSVAVDPGWSGCQSEKASGFHTRWPDEGPDVTLGHHSFYVVFQETISGGEPEPPPQQPVTLEERVTSLEGRVAVLERAAWEL